MKSFILLLFTFFISKSTFAYNSENPLDHNNFDFNNLPFEIQEQIIAYESDSYKGLPLVHKKWKNIIFSHSFYKTEKSFSFYAQKLKDSFKSKDFDQINTAIYDLIQAINHFNNDSSLLFNLKTESYRIVYLNRLNSKIKKELYQRKVAAPINQVIEEFLKEAFLNGTSDFKSPSQANNFYRFLEQILQLDFISKTQVETIFNWALSDFNQTDDVHKFYYLSFLFKAILKHPNCSIEMISELTLKVLNLNSEISLKRYIYEGISFQKLSSEETLLKIIDDADFWLKLNEIDNPTIKISALEIYTNLFSHPHFATNDQMTKKIMTKKIWLELQNRIQDFIKNYLPTLDSSDPSFQTVMENLLSSPQLLSEDKISKVISYISYFNPKQQIQLVRFLLKNKIISDSILENKIYPFVKKLILSQNVSINNYLTISDTIGSIQNQKFLFTLINEVLLNIESFDVELNFFRSITHLLNKKNLDNESFDLTGDFRNHISPALSKLTSQQYYLFLKVIYKSSNSISKQELQRFLDSPYICPEYTFAFKTLITKVSSIISLDEQKQVWDMISQSIQALPDTIQKAIYIDLIKVFFEKFPKSIFFDQMLKEIDSWNENGDLKNYGIYVISNLKFTHFKLSPRFHEILENISDNKIKSLILERLNHKLDFTDNKVSEDIQILLSSKNFEEISNFYNNDY